MNLIFLFVLVVLMVSGCHSAHVLVLAVLGSKSHTISLFPILKGLAQRGHNVTFVTPYKSVEEIEGLREIEIDNLLATSKKFKFNWFELNKVHPLWIQYTVIQAAPVLMKPILNLVMNNKVLFETIKNQHVDLVILDDSYHEFCLPLIDSLGAPFILHSASTGYPWSWGAMGATQELATIPSRFSPYTNEMKFQERLYNTAMSLGLHLMRNFFVLPTMDAINEQYFPNARPISEIEKEASLLFLSSKVETSWPRTMPPNVIPLGALHVRPAQPLPQDFQKFVEDSGENGFIVFTLGSVSSSKFMPNKHLDTFLKTFGRLSQKVIWKWDSDEQPENVPPNVLLSKWLPQQDLFGHPNARLFITHGGLLSMQEAIYHGVPLLALPFATDQYMNAAKGTKEGCSLNLEWKELDEQKLYDAITTITNQPSFKENAMRLSSIMRDQLVSGKDTAVYWVEHVIRHNGTKHLKMVSQDMPLYQYYLLDVMAFIAAVVLAVTVLFIFVLILVKRLVKRLFCGASKSGSAHLKSQ